MLYIRFENNVPVETATREAKPECGFRRQDGWQSRWDWKSYETVCNIANTLGDEYLPVDNGPYQSPRYDVIKRPVIGADASKGFNGDYYYIGKIIKITPGSAKIITVQDEKGTQLKFYRRKLSGGWTQAGGTWGLVEGIINETNWER